MLDSFVDRLWEALFLMIATPGDDNFSISQTAKQNISSTNDASSLNGAPVIGFWGPVDSSIDWCEPNYAVTNYIAEFFNTLSSIPMIFWCICGIYLTRKYVTKEKRWIFAFLGLGFTGILLFFVLFPFPFCFMYSHFFVFCMSCWRGETNKK